MFVKKIQLLVFSFSILTSFIVNAKNIENNFTHKQILDSLFYNNFNTTKVYAKNLLLNSSINEKAHIHYILGKIYCEESKPDSALENLSVSEKYFYSIGDTFNYCKTKILQANAEKLKSNFLKAYTTLQDLLIIIKNQKKTDETIVVGCHLELAILFYNLNDTLNRNNYYKLAYKGAEELYKKHNNNNRLFLIDFYMHYAVYNIDQKKDTILSKECINKAQKLIRYYSNNKLFYQKLQDVLYHYYFNTGKLEESKKCLKNILISDPIGLYQLSSNFQLAKIYYLQDSLQKSIAYLELTEKIYFNQGINVELFLEQLYRWMAFAFNKNKQYKIANEYFIKHYRINTKVLNNTQISIMTTLRFQGELAAKQYEINVLNKSKEIQLEKTKRANLGRNLILSISIFIFIIIIILSLQYRTRQKLKFDKLQIIAEKENVELEQRLLAAQMNPHFIFNSLNSIQSFVIKNKPIEAGEYLSDFARLMRLMLDLSQKKEVTINEELKLLEYYLKLEKLRTKDLFSYNIYVDSEIQESKDEITIPPFLIQPFVENAILHGLIPLKGSEGILKIVLKSINSETIQITIEDNGVGRIVSTEKKEKTHTSIASALAERRAQLLKQVMQKEIKIEFVDLHLNNQPAGTKVIITISK